MIHDILPADVEFAKGMIHASHSDAEILAALAARGLDPAKAARVLDDLRHGRAPGVQLPYPPEALFRASTRRSSSAAAHRPPAPSPQPPPPRRKHHRPRVAWWFVFLIIFFLLALGFAIFETGRGISKDAINQDKHDLPPAPGK